MITIEIFLSSERLITLNEIYKTCFRIVITNKIFSSSERTLRHSSKKVFYELYVAFLPCRTLIPLLPGQRPLPLLSRSVMRGFGAAGGLRSWHDQFEDFYCTCMLLAAYIMFQYRQ